MDEQTALTKRASKGGRARAASLSTQELSESGRRAAEARWGADLPRATHDGPLQIGDVVLVAANLANGKRLLSQGTFLQAIGRSRTPKAGTGGFSTVDGLPFFLQAPALKPFISEELMLSTTPILFRLKSGARTVGYDALLLPLVCRVYQRLHDSITARLRNKSKADAGQARKDYGRYKHIIAACDNLMDGFAQHGIIALVDNATGFQADQAHDEITKILEKYISPQLISWTRKFPHEFFREAYRLLGWEYQPGKIQHPSYMGHFINKYVYGKPFPPGVLQGLKDKSPKNEHGNRSNKLWQWLSIHTGNPQLDKVLASNIAIMQLSADMDEFEHNFDRVYGVQRYLPLPEPKRIPA